jgi:hypothetical protein
LNVWNVEWTKWFSDTLLVGIDQPPDVCVYWMNGSCIGWIVDILNSQIIIWWMEEWIAWFILKKKLHGMSPLAKYTDRATAACRQSDCQLLLIEGATWSVWRVPTAVFSVF